MQSMNLSPDPCVWDLSSPGNESCLTSERGLGSDHFENWEVLRAGWLPLSWPGISSSREQGRSLCLPRTWVSQIRARGLLLWSFQVQPSFRWDRH